MHDRRRFLIGAGLLTASLALPKRALAITHELHEDAIEEEGMGNYEGMREHGMMDVPTDAPADVKAHPTCPHCGMSRARFDYSRMLVTYDRGAEGVCSVRCFALEYAARIDRMIAKIEVADLNTTRLVDVETATWVMGGNRQGVMTRRAKWAFADPKDAAAFIAESGGEIVDWRQIVDAAYYDLYEDTNMIRQKRRERMNRMR